MLSWKFSFDHRNKLYFNIYSHRKQLFKIVITFTNMTVFTVFLDQIIIALLSMSDFFHKYITNPKLLNISLCI